VRPGEVRRVFEQGRPFHGSRMVLFLAPGTGRFAVVAARRVGGSVERNRARRVLRAVWREMAPPADNDAVVVARQAIRGATTRELMVEMSELLRRGSAGA